MAEEIAEEKESQEVDELESALEGKEEGKEDDKDQEEGEKSEKEEAEGEGGEKEKGEEESESEPDPVKALQGEVKDLRQMVRTSKRELTITQAKLARLGEKKTKARDEDDEDEDEDDEVVKGKEKKEESLSTIEELQQSISNIGASKGAALDVLLEAMEQNAKYEDIREVCSRENFDDIFEVIATDATKSGGNFDETLLEVELNIWSKANPYKYMYDLIKKYHPSYTTKEGAAGPGDKKGKTPVKAKAPGTIADKGGDSNLKSGWTAKRIDDLPEDELHTVPREIYDKYMRDELD